MLLAPDLGVGVAELIPAVVDYMKDQVAHG